ncbi:Crp/Fnr family transcriptional regulator [Cytobacillus sp. S13-E01]|uniref:Crp/Fnr family transcriptional regulator n=1 Tax=Cytobacillus sp. S13-E01 TaxID=3031326 RepID=UPI0023D841B6|nr:Crp/Fnr family transcriptional regulator [Cytobacillus sp. S13-E01]MDF0725839.1 Crp/Fnr family transcriptional regulator [Cytobacillus sp. S13-E01]
MAMILQEANKSIPYNINTLKKSIFNFLSTENIDKLQGIMNSKKLSAGQHLFWEGEQVDKMYYIQSGRVKLRTSTESGKEYLISIKEEGSLLGEFGGLNEDLHYDYRAEVTEEAEVGVIVLNDLKKLMYQFGNFAVEFMSWIGSNYRETQTKLNDLLFNDKTGALASTLIRLSTSYGVKCADGILITIELTNKEYGDYIGTSRESVNRLLNTWKREGIIDYIDRKIVIRNIDKLYDICECV